MRNELITTDLHLDDSPNNEYRWEIFPVIAGLCRQHRIAVVRLLGDILDRKDRHSATLVNRFINELNTLTLDEGVYIEILMGNHDMSIAGTHFWEFLNNFRRDDFSVSYITNPRLDGNVWMLPFTSNPKADWAELDFEHAQAVFMHQTISGAMIEGDRIIESSIDLPIFPRGLPVFSGDVHRPQKVSGITYVGAPYPVRFSEDWKNRVLIIEKGNYAAPKEVFLSMPRRAIIEISSTKDLELKKFKPGDQIRVRYKLTQAGMVQWPVEEEAIRKWAVSKSLTLVSVEAILSDDVSIGEVGKSSGLEAFAPDEVVRQFCKEEGLDEAVRDVGLEILKASIS